MMDEFGARWAGLIFRAFCLRLLHLRRQPQPLLKATLPPSLQSSEARPLLEHEWSRQQEILIHINLASFFMLFYAHNNANQVCEGGKMQTRPCQDEEFVPAIGFKKNKNI
ncbi:hypothetical protein FOQG_18228 [Fusarium oxysporum f. sp. raphani 54005]|uniref:Uncharacterized protein n=1 Tax=Fusarium oxysporum f. sp. raphani 54005 TaxID=1089458 RepID=X0B5K7_FUSOX|nr:hypothetical protein FOQG_18228 [Fusarium oxysporum f. sp. raphani 54005]